MTATTILNSKYYVAVNELCLYIPPVSLQVTLPRKLQNDKI